MKQAKTWGISNVTLKMFIIIILTLLLPSCSADTEENISFPEDSEEGDQTGNTNFFSEEEYAILNTVLEIPQELMDYTLEAPTFFLMDETADEDNTPNDNPITDEGATLGRVLFYDTNLSANGSVSCASCHVQQNGFSDPNRLSSGFEGALTDRNSMGLANARFYENGRFFWDERASSLEAQVLMPIQDDVEMGLDLAEMEEKLSAEPHYGILFSKVYGNPIVTSQRVALALAQFIRSMDSYNSKYDQGLGQTNDPEADFPNFTASENLGKDLFFSNRTQCSQCHQTNAFVGDRARNIGLDLNNNDLGLAQTTGDNDDIGKFKVPSLRNIELTAPYMHDGRFGSLNDVIDHYNNGILPHQNLDDRLILQNGNIRRPNLNRQERQALIDFLNTLTDENFISDDRFSDPFAP